MFKIQLGHPKIIQDVFEEFERVRDVFAKLFREQEESIYLFWNTIPLRFRYRQDMVNNFDNVLAMVWLINKEEQGDTLVQLENQLLNISLELRWKHDQLSIQAQFSEKSEIYQHYSQCLARQASLEVSRKEFLKEWHTLLHQFVVSFDVGNIQIKDGTERRKLEMLQRVDNIISGYGQLYERPPQ